MPPLAPALRRAGAALAVLAVTAAGGLVAPGVLARAQAAPPVEIAVDTATDAALTSGCTDGAPGTTLREALCRAADVPDAVVTVPSGTRTTLVAGPLTYAPAAAATLVVRSVGTFTVDGAGRRALDLDPGLVGGVDVTLEGITVTGGVPDASDAAAAPGGGAVLAGTGDPGRPDALTLRRCTVTGNANGPGGAQSPGGAVQMNGGSLTVEDCTFSGNTATGASGGAIAVLGADAADSVRVTGSTFDGNVVTGDAGSGIVGGGALYVAGATLTVEDSVLTGNRVDTVAPSTARGAAVHATGTTTVTGSRVDGSTATGAGGPSDGGALWLAAGAVADAVLVGNTDTLAAGPRAASVVGPVSVVRSWWGAPATATPAQLGAHGITEIEPRAVPVADADPAQPRTGAGAAVTARVALTDGAAVAPQLLARLAGAPVTWVLGDGVQDGEVDADPVLGPDGTATIRFTRSATPTGDAQATVGGVATNRVELVQPTAPTVTRPTDVEVAEGGTATFTATVTGSPAPTLQWQRAAPGGSTWVAVPGATGTSLAVTTTRADDAARYRLVATNSGGVATGEPAALVVRWGPDITSQPADVALPAGATARFTVGVAGTPAPTVQWQVATSPGAWTDVPGAVSAGYDRVLTAQDDGTQVRARATGASGTVDSAPATVTLRTLPVFTADPADVTADAGTDATFTVTVDGRPAPAVRWQSRPPAGAWADVPGATSATLTVAATGGIDGTQYRALASNATAADVPSAAATLRVLTAPTVSDPVDATVGDGTDARFVVSTTGSPAPVVTWETSSDGSTWTPVPDVTGPELVRTALAADDGLRVRARATSALVAGPVTATSAVATLTVVPRPEVVRVPDGVSADGTVTVRAGTPVVLSWVVDADLATATWQASRDGGRTWGAPPAGAQLAHEPVAAGNPPLGGPGSLGSGVAWRAAVPTSGVVRHTLTMTPAGADDGLVLRLVVTNLAGTAVTDPVTLRVTPAPTVPGAPGAPQPGAPAAPGAGAAPGAPVAPGGPGTAPAGAQARTAPARLAVTGADVAALASTGFAVVLGGAAVLLAVRRRRPTRA